MSEPVSILTPRLEPRLWGGHNLADWGVGLPEGERIGEARMAAADVLVAAGRGAGGTLVELVRSGEPRPLDDTPSTVPSTEASFPLLIKLIDAHQALSIQVHPGDATAPARSTGKTEAWHVLAAKPGAKVFAGLRPGVSLDAFFDAAEAADSRVTSLMRAIPATPGTTLLLPAGTIHAIGAGIAVYEIQQPSEITYRIHDWRRTDGAGRPRELHLDRARAAAAADPRPEPIRAVARRVALGTRHLLAACRHFALERIALPAGGEARLDSRSGPHVVVPVLGEAELDGIPFGRGRAGVVWTGDRPVPLRAATPLVALVGWVPDLERDIIRAGRASGAADDTIAALAGPLDDLGRLL